VIAAKFLPLVFCLTVAAAPVLAQGRSDAAPGRNKEKPANGAGSNAKTRAAASGLASPATSASSTSAPAATANATVYYGSWLDDATIVEPGDVWIGLATGYWTGDRNRQIDAPVASAAVGLTRRVQAGGSVSFYHFRDADGLGENGFGNVSLYGKLQLLDPYRAPDAIGVAVTPLVEIAPGSEQPMGWALPINIEAHRGAVRLYGSGGYFSRGSLFATVAADVPIASRVSVTGNFGQSYAREGARQTSLGVGASIAVSATSGAYVGVGRTFMPSGTGPGGVSLAGGMSFLLPDPRTR
jgi:hypothetical protein